MPWSGGAFTRTNGVHTGSTLWVQDRDAGTKILATRHDTHDQDLADGINATLEKSGSNAATGNLDIGSNRLTLVADGTAKTDAATVNQIQSNGPAFQATDTGTANAYVIALSPAITAYAAGQEITFKAGAASTTASTLNVNTLGTKALKKLHDQNIASGDIETGSIVTAVYDGTNFQVTSQLATEGGTPGGSNTQVQYNSSGSFAGDADLTFDGTNLTVANPLYLPDGAVATPSLANTGDLNTGVYFPAADTVGVVAGATEQFRFGSITGGANPIPGGIKNLLLNGGFKIAQRPSVTGIGGASRVYYATDMWNHYGASSSGRYTASQATAGATDGPFRYCLQIDVTTADTDTSGNKISAAIQQMEGQNLQHLNWGQATDDYPLALSFWVKSPKSGTHCVALYLIEGNDSCCTEYTVTSADTWEYITVDFPAPGTVVPAIDNDSNASLWVVFPLMATGTYQGTADAWQNNSETYATSNQQNLLDNTGNDFFLANVQLELGSISTSFAAENVGTTLEKCMRYFWRQTRLSSTNTMIAQGKANTTTTGEFTMRWSVDMRAAPTLTVSDVTEFLIRHTNTTVQTTGLTAAAAGTKSALLIATVSSGLTADEAVALQIRLDDDYIEFSAEL